MTSANLLALLGIVIKGTMLVVIGWGITRALRNAAASVRHIIWLMVIVGTLFVPIISTLAPMDVAILPREEPDAPTSVVSATINAPVDAQVWPPISSFSALDTRQSGKPTAAESALMVWAVVASFLFFRLGRSVVSLNKILRKSTVLSSLEWKRALADAASEIGLAAIPPVLMSSDVEIAFTCSALSPVIVVPASAVDWSSDRRQAVLLHELAHIRRRDLVSHAVANITCAIYWFNPFVWIAAQRLRMESELASDDVVLESGIRPSTYAQHLLDMVTSFGKGAPRLALAMAQPREFEGRLVAILDRTSLHVLGRNERRLMFGALSILSLSIGMIAPVPERTANAPSLPAISLSSALYDSATRETPRVALVTPRVMMGGGQLSELEAMMLRRLGGKAVVNPMLLVLNQQSRLQLSGMQADSLAMLSWSYTQKVGALWRAVLPEYSNGNSAPLGEIPQQTVDVIREFAPVVRALLTSSQFEQLDDVSAARLTDSKLRKLRRSVVSTPGDLIIANGPGARIGGSGTPIESSAGRGRAGR